MNDRLGDRMKHQYENRTRYMLPRRTYTIIRLDGKAFHTLLRKAQKPFDVNFQCAMVDAAVGVCNETMGFRLAYIQSDEISILLTDMKDIHTEAWFDGNVQKIASVSASIATAHFNNNDYVNRGLKVLGYFDARVFTIPDQVEVENYFIWRQKDWIRNSVTMLAQSYYSHKELHGKSQSEMHDMIHDKGSNWALMNDSDKNGRIVQRYIYEIDGGTRSKWVCNSAPTFTANRLFWDGIWNS